MPPSTSRRRNRRRQALPPPSELRARSVRACEWNALSCQPAVCGFRETGCAVGAVGMPVPELPEPPPPLGPGFAGIGGAGDVGVDTDTTACEWSPAANTAATPLPAANPLTG